MKITVELELSRRQFDRIVNAQGILKNSGLRIHTVDLLQYYINMSARTYINRCLALMDTDIYTKSYLAKDYYKRR